MGFGVTGFCRGGKYITSTCMGWITRECDPQDMAQREANMSATQADGAKQQARIEAFIGRPLTPTEMSNGLSHSDNSTIDNSTIEDRMHWRHKWQARYDTLNGIDRATPRDLQNAREELVKHESNIEKEKDPLGWSLRKTIAKLEAQYSTQAAQTARESSEDYQRLVRQCLGLRFNLLFDPRANQYYVDEAEKLVDFLLKGGDLGLCQQILSDTKTVYEAFLQNLCAAECAKLESQKAAVTINSKVVL
jgi:hypothetical protein